MTNPYNADIRRIRRQTQRAHLDTVMALPERARGGALFALWPDKLPRVVRKKLPSPVLQSWRVLRGAAVATRISEFMDAMDLMHAQILDDDDGGADKRAAIEDMMHRHGDQVRAIERLVVSVSQLKSISFSLGNGLSAKFDLDDGQDYEDDVTFGICMALELGGGITLRQTLPLRSHVKNDQGQMEWRAQERVYGISCHDGQWEGLSAAQMRQAYEHDREGRRLEADPITSFGDAKDLIRGLK